LIICRCDDRIHHEQAEEVADRDRCGSAGKHESDRFQQVRTVTENDTEHRAEHRHHQWSDDHGADDDGGRVSDDTGCGDHRRVDLQNPEPTQLPRGVRSIEEHGLAHVADVID
jgi:hypothetical protein